MRARHRCERDVRRQRLAGGYEEENGVRPYAAFLHFTEDIHCSGAIVSATSELTAAHCYIDTENVTNAYVFAGNVWFRNKEDFEPPTQTRRLKLCRSYNALAVREFDIMICRHEQPWNFDKYFVSPVQIFMFTERLNPAFKLRCQVAGFGRKETGLAVGYLHAYRQVMETWRACRDFASEQFMCTTDTRNKTMCSGDAGGPVVCLVNRRLQLFGLLSASSAPEEECCETPVAWNLVTFLGFFRPKK
ncbi:ovochymase-2-like [Schistocerca piceifrons]|uniref:ovochymase-2-like n=1 Tax=Schistocerca piceifrons TaxID=274613 RepID=UPI001F5FE48E|nr:ovochymase-2-like [Schistocerca piceifrons]